MSTTESTTKLRPRQKQVIVEDTEEHDEVPNVPVKQVKPKKNKITPTFVMQDELPDLPVPDMEQTLEKYVASVRPLLTDEEFENTKRIVEEFKKEGGVGEELQQLLEDRAEEENAAGKNWLYDWWYQYAYHLWKDPTIINTNVFFSFYDHPMPITNVTRLSFVARELMLWKQKLDREEVEVDFLRNFPLCMDQYRRVVGTTRIPDEVCDYLRLEKESRTLLVMRKGQFWIVEIVDKDGEVLHYADLRNQVQYIKDQADATSAMLEPQVGMLTTMRRDEWARAREYLQNLDERNKENLEAVEMTNFAICLDDVWVEDNDKKSTLAFHGNKTCTGNRFFDKCMSFVCSENGKMGTNVEHSWGDAVVPSSILESFMHSAPRKLHGPGSKKYRTVGSGKELTPPRKLEWVLDDKMLHTIDVATAAVYDLIDDSHYRVLIFDEFGTTFMTRNAKVSPDAFVQMALQLAYYRHYGYLVSTYESVHTRAFRGGRTECARTCSSEALTFVQTMEDKWASKQDKAKALSVACKAHVGRLMDGLRGQGIDRHLLGWRVAAYENGVDEPELFTDKGYRASSCWTLSTSQAPTLSLAWGGFGPTTDDGIGVNYQLHREVCTLSITTKTRNTHIDASTFRSLVFDALMDMSKLYNKLPPKL